MTELDLSYHIDLDELEEMSSEGQIPSPWDSTVYRLILRLRAAESAVTTMSEAFERIDKMLDGD